MSITQDVPVDFGLFQEWMQDLIRSKGTDLYRMKGVLDVRFATEKYVYHAVHMIYNGEFEVWGSEEAKGSKLVFIGKNLDAPALRAGFAACLATADNLEKKLQALRFKVGDRVECNMSEGSWMAVCRPSGSSKADLPRHHRTEATSHFRLTRREQVVIIALEERRAARDHCT